jgi:hypothetical protein
MEDTMSVLQPCATCGFVGGWVRVAMQALDLDNGWSLLAGAAAGPGLCARELLRLMGLPHGSVCVAPPR